MGRNHPTPDILFHLGLTTESHDLKRMFGDVKFVCLGGSARRMESMAHYLMKELNLGEASAIHNIASGADRYALFKVGPILCANHGIGNPSMSILVNELIKLLDHADCTDVTFFRIGTCGGIGVNPGSVIITKQAFNETLKPEYCLPILGEIRSFSTEFDGKVQAKLLDASKVFSTSFNTIMANTVCMPDFYESQARRDGAFCDYSIEEKMAYMQKLLSAGVCNFEMESTAFGALVRRAGFKAAVICLVLVDRLKDDIPNQPEEVFKDWELRPQLVVAELLKRELAAYANEC